MRDTVRAESFHSVDRDTRHRVPSDLSQKLNFSERLAIEEIFRRHRVVDLRWAQVLLGPKVIRASHQVIEDAAHDGLITIDTEHLLVRWVS